MRDPVIESFRAEFNRFHDLLLKQVEIFPDGLWNKKAGGYVVWQQFFHTFACVEFFALPEGASSKQTLYPADVVMFKQTPEKGPSKDEVRQLAASMKDMVNAFLDGQSTATLADKHEVLSRYRNQHATNQNAIVSLIRHACYHLGCCDAILREHGLPGVH